MFVLKIIWWSLFIGSAIASIGSFTNEKANSMGRLKNYAGIFFLTIFVITYFLGTFFNFIPEILTIFYELFYWIFTFSAFLQILWWYIFVGSFFVSMSLFLSLISREEGPKERFVLSFVSGFICILTFLLGMYLGYV
tara:strand:+ start:494 stop:904 length:411 start_codon:yes stop_codon:yes gene_type:complete